ncbi:MAG: hypothetical protein U1F39_13875 [Steroidobacteraceae bacterium]
MMRIAVFVLIAANLLYFGWTQWVDQDTPNLTAVAAAPRKPLATTPPPPPAPPPCAALGPFVNDIDAAAAEQKLTAAGWGVLKRNVTEQVREGWWVYVTNSSASAQARTLNAMRAAGLRDAFAMPDDPEHKVSAGIFSEESRAEDRASRVQRLRLDAVVKERTTEQSVTWIDIPGVARETLSDGRLEKTGLQLERLRIEACPAKPVAPADGAAISGNATPAAAAPAAADSGAPAPSAGASPR